MEVSYTGKRLVVSSVEVAEAIGKKHKNLLQDIRGYIADMEENLTAEKSAVRISDYFIESMYTTSRGKNYPCYLVTQKGCEFIAHKLTGKKGTQFTRAYIEEFHRRGKQLGLEESEETEKPIERKKPRRTNRKVKIKIPTVLKNELESTDVDELIESNSKIYWYLQGGKEAIDGMQDESTEVESEVHTPAIEEKDNSVVWFCKRYNLDKETFIQYLLESQYIYSKNKKYIPYMKYCRGGETNLFEVVDKNKPYKQDSLCLTDTGWRYFKEVFQGSEDWRI